MLQPTASLRRLLLWSDYYLRYDETFWSTNQLFDSGQQTDTEEVNSRESIHACFISLLLLSPVSFQIA